METGNTKTIHNWMKNLDDDAKMRFAINWKTPHTLFNIAYKMKSLEGLQEVDWFKIYKSRDLGTWSHGGKVTPI